MSILKLRDEGKLSLDDPAERYVPEMKALSIRPATRRGSRSAICCRTPKGFPKTTRGAIASSPTPTSSCRQMLSGGIPFSNAPGIAYEYSNYGFAILGRIVSNVSGAEVCRLRRRANILKPLGMTSTTLEPSAVPANRLAHGYRWEDEQWKNEPLLANGSFGSMGGMLTSVSDLSRYVGAFLSAWPPRDGPETAPIRRASLREMQQVWRPAPSSVARDAVRRDSVQRRRLCLRPSRLAVLRFRQIVAHSGGLPGFGSVMRWLPEYGVGIIAFGNLTYTGWGRVTTTAFDSLVKTGGLQPRQPAAVARADRRAPRGVEADRALGRCARRQHRRGEPVSRRVEGSAARRDRAPARNGRRVHAGERASTAWKMPCADAGR